jgi:hypothetical protein
MPVASGSLPFGALAEWPGQEGGSLARGASR